MATDLYDEFHTAYSHYNETRVGFFRTVRFLHLNIQYRPDCLSEDEYDRFILRYADSYTFALRTAKDNSTSPLPTPFEFYHALEPDVKGDENRMIIINQSMLAALPLVCDIVLPVLEKVRDYYELDPKEPSEALETTPIGTDVIEMTITITLSNVDAVQAWVDWKRSPVGTIDTQEIINADYEMFDLAVQGNIDGVMDLVNALDDKMMPVDTIDNRTTCEPHQDTPIEGLMPAEEYWAQPFPRINPPRGTTEEDHEMAIVLEFLSPGTLEVLPDAIPWIYQPDDVSSNVLPIKPKAIAKERTKRAKALQSKQKTFDDISERYSIYGERMDNHARKIASAQTRTDRNRASLAYDKAAMKLVAFEEKFQLAKQNLDNAKAAYDQLPDTA